MMDHRDPRRMLPTLLLPALVLAVACQGDPQPPSGSDGAGAPPTAMGGAPTPPVVLAEAFLSPMDTLDDVDSPAAWRGPDGRVVLMATAKGSHVIMTYDGATGESLGRRGRPGAGPGEFQRPNGILVHGDLLFVVERDNRRVQVLTLPDFEPVTTFGDDVLLKPYGITGVPREGGIDLWITDDFDVTGEGAATWENRVKRFAVETREAGIQARMVATVGGAEGPGRLVVVESILADEAHGRLLIADEDESQRVIKVFDLDGRFTGQTMGEGVFTAEPEGLALWACGTEGYLLLADQSHEMNRFHVFDRVTLEHRATFAGEAVANTDGVALLQGPVGALGEGAFYAIHADQGVVGFSWADIAEALGLRATCTTP